jgi:hypothetical protein
MLKWADKQPVEVRHIFSALKADIGETYGALDCALCDLFVDMDCRGCPLDNVGECCIDSNSAHSAVDRSYTCSEFATSIRKYMMPALLAALKDTQSEPAGRLWKVSK